MKKYFSTALFIMFLSSSLLTAGPKFYFDLSGSYLNSPDMAFRSLYGEDAVLPELTAGIQIIGDFYLWAAYGFFNSKAVTDYLQEEMKARQSYLSAGLSYRRMISDDFGFKIMLAAVQAGYKEEGMDTEVSGSVPGFRADGGLIMYIGKVYVELANGYIYARDTVNSQEIKLGGYKVSLALGIQF